MVWGPLSVPAEPQVLLLLVHLLRRERRIPLHVGGTDRLLQLLQLRGRHHPFAPLQLAP